MNPRFRTSMMLLGVLLAGCASDDGDFANDPRPPAPITVTATISEKAITVSPLKFGGGPVVFIIANQTDAAHQITLESDTSNGPGIRQTTSKINPDGTASLKVDMKAGAYDLSAPDESIRPARITVGPPRESAQNELLQP